MWLVGLSSTIAIIASFLAMPKTRKKIAHFVKYVADQIYFQYLGAYGVISDNLDAFYNITELPHMTGRTAIVTGGSRGIGAEVVRKFLICDMTVIVACRNIEVGELAIKKIRESGVKSGSAKVYELDNASLRSVRSFAKKFKEDFDKLDILVNNAGVMFPPYEETEDGFELQYQINYLSHFLLTSLLLPALKRAGTSGRCARVVNVSSLAHYGGEINFDDVNYKEDFISSYGYSQSKLAQLLSTKRLARLFEEHQLPIKIHAIHPGVVNTDIFENSYVTHFGTIKRLLFKSPSNGSTPIVFAAVSPKIENKTGLYIDNCKEASVKKCAEDVSIQNRLFDLSLKQLRMTNFLSE